MKWRAARILLSRLAVQGTARLGERFAQPVQVAQVIVLAEEEGGFAVVAALDDV
jgi:hypothetical protein